MTGESQPSLCHQPAYNSQPSFQTGFVLKGNDMFTGIIESIGSIRAMTPKGGDVRLLVDTGKLDLGGGGTVAKYVANQDIDTIDIGVPVLSMHSPFEIVSKADVYMAYLTFKAFCEDAE